jgi:hypothetical protein
VRKIILPVRFLLIVIGFLLRYENSSAQVVYAGVKGGFNMSWIKHDDQSVKYKQQFRILPTPGYNAGFVASFKMKDRFFLHTEYLFSTKGKLVRGKLDKQLKDQVTYYYVEIPIIYNIFFDAKLNTKNIKRFKWYAGVGPNFSYWLGGKGKVYNGEFADEEYPALKYKLKFGERGEDRGQKDLIYISDAKRFQLGVNFGGGILLEPVNGRKIMVDLRFELGHTWLGKEKSADYVIPVDYKEARNLKDRNMGLRLSLMYLFEGNLDKKVRNKGKSDKPKSLKKRRI